MRAYRVILALIAFMGLCAFDINGGGGGGSPAPGTMDFLVNPEDLRPVGTGHIWFADSSVGSDSNDCESPARACLTFHHVYSLSSATDVIGLNGQGWFMEDNLLINHAIQVVSLGGYGMGTRAWFYPLNPIHPIFHVYFSSADFYGVGFDTDSYHGREWPVIYNQWSYGIFRHCLLNGPFSSIGAGVIFDDDRLQSIQGANMNIRVRNSTIGPFFGTSGYVASPDIDILDTGGHGYSYSWEVTNNTFLDSFTIPTGHKFIDLRGSTAGLVNVAGNRFPGDVLHRSTVLMPTGMNIGSNSPGGDVGSTVSGQSQRETVTSIDIKTAAQYLFTADGALDIDDILLQTDATGLAGGTNLVITTDNTTGPATVCSVPIVANLGANKTVSCAATGSMVPFQLEDTKSLKVACSGSDCTGSGTVTIIPKMRRAQEYSAVYAIPVPSPTPTANPTPTWTAPTETPTATPT